MAVKLPIHRGLTLLELLLALALSSLVLFAVGMAIDLHFRLFDTRRTSVEEAQLARSLLRHIADDLRSAVQNMPIDLSGLEEVTSNTATAVGAMNSGITGDDADGGSGGGGGQGNNSSGGQSGDNSSTNDLSSALGGGFANPMQADAGGASKGGSTSGGASGGSTGGASGGSSSAQSDDGAAMPAADDTMAAAAPVLVVGLYGSATQMQFDISRLPRIDQYQAILSADSQLGVVDIPSDIKTITYFLRSEDSAAAGNAPVGMAAAPQPSITGRGSGLMRRELDRAVGSWAEQNGNVGDTFADAKLLAAEVASLQFQYFDGTQWLAEWNSDTSGGLPMAVEVILSLRSAQGDAETADASPLASPMEAATSSLALPGEKVYRQVVHLPIAKPAEPATEMAEGGEATGEVAEELP